MNSSARALLLTAAKIFRRELNRAQSVEYLRSPRTDPRLAMPKAIIDLLTELGDFADLEAYYKNAIARLPKDAPKEDKLAV